MPKAVQSTDRRAYSLAAGAAVFGALQADGAIVYSELQNIVIDQGNALTLELNGDDPVYNDSDLILKNYIFSGVNYMGVTVRYAPGRLVGFRAGPNMFAYATALTEGAPIDLAAMSAGVFFGSMAHGTVNPNAQFNEVDNAYLGFSFPIVGMLHYGWVRVTVNQPEGTFVIRDWAYEDVAGEGILAGQKPGAPPTPGDYNGDGTVDAADYTVWRDTLGSTVDLSADGDSSGTVDTPDYDIWKTNFSTGGAVASAAVPEPPTLGLLAAGAVGLALLRRERQSFGLAYAYATKCRPNKANNAKNIPS